MQFDADGEKYLYELNGRATNYFQKSSGDNISLTDNGKKNQDFRLMPKAYVMYHIIGVDTGLFYKSILINNIGFHIQNRNPWDHSKLVDTFTVFPEIPGSTVNIVYFVYDEVKDTLLYMLTDKTTAPGPMDTTVYEKRF